MKYCRLFAAYTDDNGCSQCDINAGYEAGTWRETCHRDEHHPILSDVKWWLKPKSFKFKLYIIIRWLTRRLPLANHWLIWSDKGGLHIGNWKRNWHWFESRPLEESTNG